MREPGNCRTRQAIVAALALAAILGASSRSAILETPSETSVEKPGPDAITSAGLPADVAPEIEVEEGGLLLAVGSGPLVFGSAARGDALPLRTFIVRNLGGGTLETSRLSVPPGFVVREGLSPSIPPGASDTFTVGLSAAGTGTVEGNVCFTTNDANENEFWFVVEAHLGGMLLAAQGGGFPPCL